MDRPSRRDIEFALGGANAAIERVTRGVKPELAAAEGTFWIASVDEALAGRPRSQPYIDACVTDEVWSLLQGIRYARNQAAHALVTFTTEIRGHGMVGPIVQALSGPSTIWRGTGDLPIGHHPDLLDAYLASLAGHGVAETLKKATVWLNAYELPV